MHPSWKEASREKLLELIEWQDATLKARQELLDHYRGALMDIAYAEQRCRAEAGNDKDTLTLCGTFARMALGHLEIKK